MLGVNWWVEGAGRRDYRVPLRDFGRHFAWILSWVDCFAGVLLGGVGNLGWVGMGPTETLIIAELGGVGNLGWVGMGG